MTDLNYKHLRYFQAVAHEGNLTRAAERLNLSQSALSVQIRTLEDRLDQKLFDRVGRQLRLTEAGRIALDHADTIFRTGEELLATLSETGHPRRAVRIGAMATLSRNFQMSFLRPLIDRADVEVVLRSGSLAELLPALDALALDVVLTNQTVARDAATPFISHLIAEQPVSLIGTPRRCPQSRDIRDLVSDTPLILPTRETGLRAAFDAWAARHDLLPQIAAEVDDIAMMRLLAREDAGIAVLPPIAVRDELASGRLVEAARIDGLAESFFAVTRTRRFANPLVAELLHKVGSQDA